MAEHPFYGSGTDTTALAEMNEIAVQNEQNLRILYGRIDFCALRTCFAGNSRLRLSCIRVSFVRPMKQRTYGVVISVAATMTMQLNGPKRASTGGEKETEQCVSAIARYNNEFCFIIKNAVIFPSDENCDTMLAFAEEFFGGCSICSPTPIQL